METERNSIIIVDPQPELSEETLVTLYAAYQDTFIVVSYEDALRLLAGLFKNGPLPRCLVLPVHSPTITLQVFLQAMFELQVQIPIVVIALGRIPLYREALLVNLHEDFPLCVCVPSEVKDRIAVFGRQKEPFPNKHPFKKGIEELNRDVRKKNLFHLAALPIDAKKGRSLGDHGIFYE